jgi:hypothetical protein
MIGYRIQSSLADTRSGVGKKYGVAIQRIDKVTIKDLLLIIYYKIEINISILTSSLYVYIPLSSFEHKIAR